MKVLCVGAGLSGAVIGRVLAQAGHAVTVIDQRPHLAGNCHTEHCPETGVMEHRYGPHIFHTDQAKVWEFVGQYCEMMPYVHRVKSCHNGTIYPMPISLLTISQFLGREVSAEEAQAWIESEQVGARETAVNFEQAALATIGRPLYEAFFRGYTEKQWGRDPKELPASVFARLPVRFEADDNYFNHPYQGIPREGYTEMVAKILDHPQIQVSLNTRFDPQAASAYDHTFYSGAIDAYYGYSEGELAYRTLEFEREIHPGNYQACAQLNFADAHIPYTRITEHKHFAPWQECKHTVIYREYSREATRQDTPYYPIRLAEEQSTLKRYQALAAREPKLTFVGRLGTYRYLDMDVTIGEALETAERFLARSPAM